MEVWRQRRGTDCIAAGRTGKLHATKDLRKLEAETYMLKPKRIEKLYLHALNFKLGFSWLLHIRAWENLRLSGRYDEKNCSNYIEG